MVRYTAAALGLPLTSVPIGGPMGLEYENMATLRLVESYVLYFFCSVAPQNKSHLGKADLLNRPSL